MKNAPGLGVIVSEILNTFWLGLYDCSSPLVEVFTSNKLMM